MNVMHIIEKGRGLNMAILSQEVKDLFNSVDDVIFSTASVEGQPNSCVVGMKCIIDDQTLYMSDQFFKKTLNNVIQNPQVSIAFWKGHDAFQIYGTARYVNEGEEFAAQKEWVDAKFQEKGLPITSKGGCFVHVDAVYQMAAGPEAGERIA